MPPSHPGDSGPSNDPPVSRSRTPLSLSLSLSVCVTSFTSTLGTFVSSFRLFCLFSLFRPLTPSTSPYLALTRSHAHTLTSWLAHARSDEHVLYEYVRLYSELRLCGWMDGLLVVSSRACGWLPSKVQHNAAHQSCVGMMATTPRDENPSKNKQTPTAYKLHHAARGCFRGPNISQCLMLLWAVKSGPKPE